MEPTKYLILFAIGKALQLRKTNLIRYLLPEPCTKPRPAIRQAISIASHTTQACVKS